MSLGKYFGCATYVDVPEAGTVAGGHVRVERLGGVHPRHLTVLLVHVVGAGPRVVADPDAEVLDLLGVLLVDLPGCALAGARPGLPSISLCSNAPGV